METRYRSRKRIRKRDLERLLEIAMADQTNFFNRNPAIQGAYQRRLACVALCQGAALHCIDRETGIKDFDVWSFYRPCHEKAFPMRRPRTVWDFGDPRFGYSPDSPSEFVGKRVDVFVKAIHVDTEADDLSAIRHYLRRANTRTARFLAEKPVILLYPSTPIGDVLWMPVAECVS